MGRDSRNKSVDLESQPTIVESNDPARPGQVIMPDGPAIKEPEKPLVDLSGAPSEIKKALGMLFERVAVLEAKTATMPLHAPLSIPQDKDFNTDFVAGL
jgi:hypothetical protein